MGDAAPRKKIVVLAGGNSTEREVSLSSGRRIFQALKNLGYRTVLLDVYLGYEGEIRGLFEQDADLTAQDGALIGEDSPDPEKWKKLRSDGGKEFFGPNVLALCQMADCVFLALHGENGENGKVQACLELFGVPYTGTDFASSAMAMDKGISKDMFRAWGIPTPEGIRLQKGEKDPREISLPCVVKAGCQGSSVSVSIVEREEAYEPAKQEAFRYGDEILIERYIRGREFSVGVLEGRALPVIEMIPRTGFYDYRAKYQAGSAREVCPAQLSPEKTGEIQRIAERVFRALRLKSYARVDFMMDEQERFFCLEANTLPGMTPTSLMPQEALAEGMDFETLCRRILEYALRTQSE